MRYSGMGLDPRVNIYDLSSDSIGHAVSQMELMQATLNKMADWTPAQGNSYQEAVDGAGLIIRLWSISAGVISRWIGGVYVDRAMAGQEEAVNRCSLLNGNSRSGRWRCSLSTYSRQLLLM